MIAWNGCEKLLAMSSDCVPPDQQDELFFKSIKPSGKAELGSDLTFDLKLLDIKVK